MHNLEMFASTQDLEFVQGQSRDVPDRKLGPNILTTVVITWCYNDPLGLNCSALSI